MKYGTTTAGFGTKAVGGIAKSERMRKTIAGCVTEIAGFSEEIA